MSEVVKHFAFLFKNSKIFCICDDGYCFARYGIKSVSPRLIFGRNKGIF